MKITLALKDAAESGLQATVTWQFPPARTAFVQLSLSVKFVGFVPPSETMGEPVSVPPPVLVNVIVLVGLVLPTFTLPNAALAGESETAGVPPPETSGCG